MVGNNRRFPLWRRSADRQQRAYVQRESLSRVPNGSSSRLARYSFGLERADGSFQNRRAARPTMRQGSSEVMPRLSAEHRPERPPDPPNVVFANVVASHFPPRAVPM